MPFSAPKSYLDQLNVQGLLNQLEIYRREGDDASLYVFLFRFANLLVGTLQKYPNRPKNHQKYLHYTKKLRNEYMPELERLKEKFSKLPPVVTTRQSRVSGTLTPVGLSTASGVNWQHSGVSMQEPLPPRPSDAIVPEFQASNSIHLPPPIYESKYSASSAGREKHNLIQTPAQNQTSTVTPKIEQSIALYPSVNKMEAPTQPPPPAASTPPPVDQPLIELSIPPEPVLGPQPVESTAPPGTPVTDCSCHPPALSANTTTALSTLTHAASQVQEVGIRNVHLSVEMLETFLRVAKSNTRREIETCAILAGELKPGANILEINHLLVPRQKGTRDQVEMIDEELLLGEVLSNGLMVLGWIHTHPIFQCFLSSIDVHTTLPYQLLLEEAIAIVMAPTDRKRKCGVFRLSTPGGMDLIRDCPRRGFHHHGDTSTGQQIYEVCSHVFYDPRLKVTVKDMR